MDVQFSFFLQVTKKKVAHYVITLLTPVKFADQDITEMQGTEDLVEFAVLELSVYKVS